MTMDDMSVGVPVMNGEPETVTGTSLGPRDLRDWMEAIEALGQLNLITTLL